MLSFCNLYGKGAAYYIMMDTFFRKTNTKMSVFLSTSLCFEVYVMQTCPYSIRQCLIKL